MLTGLAVAAGRRYADYTNQTQLLVSLFAAAQAPVLFSRDLRHRSIVLYLARPLSAPVFALMRWLSLSVATLALHGRADPAALRRRDARGPRQERPGHRSCSRRSCSRRCWPSLVAGITGLISSVSLRRGFAVVGSVMALIVLTGVITAVQAISHEEDADAVSVGVGLFSPWSLYTGLANAWDAGIETFVPVDGAWVPAYVLVALLIVAGCLLALVARFRKVGSR